MLYFQSDCTHSTFLYYHHIVATDELNSLHSIHSAVSNSNDKADHPSRYKHRTDSQNNVSTETIDRNHVRYIRHTRYPHPFHRLLITKSSISRYCYKIGLVDRNCSKRASQHCDFVVLYKSCHQPIRGVVLMCRPYSGCLCLVTIACCNRQYNNPSGLGIPFSTLVILRTCAAHMCPASSTW